MEELIKQFLNITPSISSGDGYGDGSGDGYGYGSGYGYVYGSGNGSGSGSGSGYDDGDGDGDDDDDDDDGYGYGISIFNNQKVYIIDDIQTIITNVKQNIAKGYILNKDFTLSTCYIVKENNQFAHGSTLKEAFESLQEKLYNNTPVEERIKLFKEKFTNYKKKYKASELFVWHNILTSSCKFGREAFCREHNIDVKKNKLTILEFIKLTENSYGGEIIKQLK